MTKAQLVDWLVRWRQEVGGSISPHNHRRILATRKKADLQRLYDQIHEQSEKKNA